MASRTFGQNQRPDSRRKPPTPNHDCRFTNEQASSGQCPLHAFFTTTGSLSAKPIRCQSNDPHVAADARHTMIEKVKARQAAAGGGHKTKLQPKDVRSMYMSTLSPKSTDPLHGAQYSPLHSAERPPSVGSGGSTKAPSSAGSACSRGRGFDKIDMFPHYLAQRSEK